MPDTDEQQAPMTARPGMRPIDDQKAISWRWRWWRNLPGTAIAWTRPRRPERWIFDELQSTLELQTHGGASPPATVVSCRAVPAEHR